MSQQVETPRLNSDTSAQMLTSEQAVELAAEVAAGQKGLDICPLDVREITDITEFILIASGTSQRHVIGITDKIKLALKKHNDSPISVSGYEGGDWVLLDYGNFIIHVFHIPVRDYYQIEELWKDGKLIRLPEELEQIIRRQRTKTIPFQKEEV